MFFSKFYLQFKDFNKFEPIKMGVSSNASHNNYHLRGYLGFQAKFKKLLFFKKWAAGRSAAAGRIVVYTKGPRGAKIREPYLNYNFRDSSLFFMGGANYISYRKKIGTLLFTSSGTVCYVPLNLDYTFFTFLKLKSLLGRSLGVGTQDFLFYKPFVYIKEVSYLLLQQNKNTPISFLESSPLGGVKYTRSIGSKSIIKKMDTRTGLGLVLLSSGLKKVCSIFSLARSGRAIDFIPKKKLRNTKFGFYYRSGKKPKVRGIAMNPVDHPHGGRTNSIKYPRSPWGKTTKYK